MSALLFNRHSNLQVAVQRTSNIDNHYVDFDFSQENPRLKTFPARTHRVLDVMVTPPPDEEADDQ